MLAVRILVARISAARIAAVASLAFLAACSTSETLQPVTAAAPVAVTPPASIGQPQVAPPAPNASVAAIAPATSAAPGAANALVQPAVAAAPPSALASTHLAIAPVTGAPRQVVSPLSRAMAARGQAIGLDFTRGGGITTHTLRGFFSVNDDGGEVRVVYIWDVLNRAGARVHRIRGQERIPGTRAGRDPWSGVSADVMSRIGATTIDRFAAWRQG